MCFEVCILCFVFYIFVFYILDFVFRYMFQYNCSPVSLASSLLSRSLKKKYLVSTIDDRIQCMIWCLVSNINDRIQYTKWCLLSNINDQMQCIVWCLIWQQLPWEKIFGEQLLLWGVTLSVSSFCKRKLWRKKYLWNVSNVSITYE